MLNKMVSHTILIRDQMRFWQSCDLEPLLSHSGEEGFVARKVLANRIILLAMTKARESGREDVYHALEKAHTEITCGGEVKDIFDSQSWRTFLSQYISNDSTITLTTADTGLSHSVTLTFSDSLLPL
jgi:hypothetical protein